MGIEDLLRKKQERAKLKKKVIKISDLDKIAADEEKNRQEELVSRIGIAQEKTSWITKKKEEAADWSSGPSDHEEEDVVPFEAHKKTEDLSAEMMHKPKEEVENSSEVKAWGAASNVAKEVVNEKRSNEPGAFVPSALKMVSGVRPKLEDAMEFPSLDVAAKEETVKPKIEVEKESDWKTAGRQDTDSYSGDGRYRNRNYGDDGGFGGSRQRRRDPPMEENADWSRGKTVTSTNSSFGGGGGGGGGFRGSDSDSRKPMMRQSMQDSSPGLGFQRGVALKSQDLASSRPTPTARPYRPPTSAADAEQGSWSRGNVINSSLSGSDSRPSPMQQTSFEMRAEAKEKEYQLRHKNRFEALSELN